MNARQALLSTINQKRTKPVISSSDPFDSVADFEVDRSSKPSTSASSRLGFSAANARYRNEFRDSGGIENQSVQELENYAVYKAEETTNTLNGCLKIAEEMREDASNTLVKLHQQGQQITRTHQAVADIEHDLSRGEKLLGSLGGLFSKTWKPKKTHKIKGPLPVPQGKVQPIFWSNKKGQPDVRSSRQRGIPGKHLFHLEQRQKLGLATAPPRSEPRHLPSEQASALEKVEHEKAKQDDVLSDLSNLLGELRSMAIDMGSEIERQNVALDRMQDDTDEIHERVKGANQQGRRLLGK